MEVYCKASIIKHNRNFYVDAKKTKNVPCMAVIVFVVIAFVQKHCLCNEQPRTMLYIAPVQRLKSAKTAARVFVGVTNAAVKKQLWDYVLFDHRKWCKPYVAYVVNDAVFLTFGGY